MLELEHAHKTYRSPSGPIQAVNDLSVSIGPEELVALYGPSGSGKTTLLLLAAGLLHPDAGRVSFEGRDLATLSKGEMLAHRRLRLGFVFQDFKLIPGLSAQENVALPLLMRGEPHRDAHKQARSALEEVSLADRADHMPKRLSGGEQQRVALARALVGKPRLVLADEPTGNLDSETGDHVLELLSSLTHRRSIATVVVTHDVRVAGYANRVLGMRDGRLTEPDLEAQPAFEG
jgi:putative ABC transport system ATP-binding protein